MLKIDDAIIKSKKLQNISDGGSECYDFGNAVLVRYTIPLKYVKPGYRARENQESVMVGVNKKASEGVNTPKHIEMKRVVEGENDVCYVLQEKCKGKNCASMGKYGALIERVLKELEFVSTIPFEHYEKLVSDACMLYEMGYEAKNKNLFYDEETGFWFIDFLHNKEDQQFDSSNPKKIFETLKYVCPKPAQIASQLSYDAKISDEDRKNIESLSYAAKAKYFLACKKVIPTFNKYEFFYLLEEPDDYKKYLMENGIVERDLFSATNEDFDVYNELYSNVVNEISEEVSINGEKFWQVAVNDIRINSNLFSLNKFYREFICEDIKKDDFEDDWEYEKSVDSLFTSQMMDSIYDNLTTMPLNDNISSFISDYRNSRGLTKDQNKK